MTDDKNQVPEEVLFVCVHNAGRSQMAAALLEQLAGNTVTVRSAGSAPADQVNPAVVAAMAEIGIDLTHQVPTKLTGDDVTACDVVITMGCGDTCPVYPGKRYLDWDIPDPAGLPVADVRTIRDQINAKVRMLLAELSRRPEAHRSHRRRMELTMLSVPDCPHAPVLRERLNQVLGDRRDVHIAWHTVDSDAAAAATRMPGSPTLLIDGRDPFAGETPQPPSMSCRLYPDENGTTQGAPSVAQLRAVLAGHDDPPTRAR